MKPTLYDVFLCHNGKDKPAVTEIEAKLRARGLRCWLDRHELRPGGMWQHFVHNEWPRIGAMIVCIGPHGISDGQRYEIETLVPAALRTQSIVPVFLPTLDAAADARLLLPAVLEGRTWIDFRDHAIDPLDALVWGISGENPHVRLSIGNLYRDADGLEDDALLAFLGEVTAKNQRGLGYPKQVREVLMDAFEDPLDPDNVILFHDGRSLPRSGYGPTGPRSGSWNLDHIWPKAFGFRENRRVIADLHNIAIADMAYNARRGAGFFYDRRLDFTERETEIVPTRHFDPRGVIARACFYMVVRYQGHDAEPALILDERPHVIGENHLGSLETLLYWNRLARVTPAERLRNDRIADAQGNRNPFVDRPEFADLLWYPV